MIMQFNEFGVPINPAEEAMNFAKPHEKFLEESGIEMNIGWAGVALGVSAVQGYMSSRNKRKNEQRQAQRQYEMEQRAYINNVKQQAYKSRFDELMIETKNKRTKEVFDFQIQDYKQQRKFNAAAAHASFAAEQFRLNETFEQAALQRNEQIKELMRAQGEAAASGRGNTNRSKERANMLNTLAEFGAEQVEMNKTLYSSRQAFKQRMGGIAGQHFNHDYSAWTKIAIAPMLDIPGMSPMPGPSPVAPAKVSGGFFSDLMAGASAGISGGMTIKSMGGKW